MNKQAFVERLREMIEPESGNQIAEQVPLREQLRAQEVLRQQGMTEQDVASIFFGS